MANFSTAFDKYLANALDLRGASASLGIDIAKRCNPAADSNLTWRAAETKAHISNHTQRTKEEELLRAIDATYLGGAIARAEEQLAKFEEHGIPRQGGFHGRRPTG